MIDERLKEKLLAMTWDGLREWSEPRSVDRGKEYVGRVETSAAFADGSVVSEVHGSDDYYIKLSVDADGDLRGEAKMTNRRWKTAQEELSYAEDARLDEDDDLDDEDACDEDEFIGDEDEGDEEPEKYRIDPRRGRIIERMRLRNMWWG